MTVEAAGELLGHAYHAHRSLMRAIAGSLIRVPEFEVKVELAHHLYQHAEAAHGLRRRIQELRVPLAWLDANPSTPSVILCNELLHADDTAELVCGIHGVAAHRLREFERRYIAETDPLADQPSVRLLRRVLADLDGMVAWAEEVVAAFSRCGIDTCRFDRWRAHVDDVLAASGGFAHAKKATPMPSLRSVSRGAYQRPITCARDDRLPTFHHTRRYDLGDLPAPGAPRSSFDEERIAMIRVQRDELDAIETFANVLFDFKGAPFDLEFALARFIWDEARHAEIGQQSLERVGLDPFSVPCGTIGINVRAPLPPLLAFAQISVFGELHQVAGLRRFAKKAYAAGDGDTGRCFDFIHADELMHVRVGRNWLQQLAAEGGTNLRSLEEEARQAAIARLVKEGVLGEDYEAAPTAQDLARMIGE